MKYEFSDPEIVDAMRKNQEYTAKLMLLGFEVARGNKNAYNQIFNPPNEPTLPDADDDEESHRDTEIRELDHQQNEDERDDMEQNSD